MSALKARSLLPWTRLRYMWSYTASSTVMVAPACCIDE